MDDDGGFQFVTTTVSSQHDRKANNQLARAHVLKANRLRRSTQNSAQQSIQQHISIRPKATVTGEPPPPCVVPGKPSCISEQHHEQARLRGWYSELTNTRYDVNLFQHLPKLLRQPTMLHVNRSQVFSEFLSVYLPRARDRSLDSLSYMEVIPEAVASASLLQAVCDAFMFSYLGTLHDDYALQVRGLERYGSAVSSLQRIFTAPLPKRIRKDVVLASVVLLAQAEVYTISSRTQEERVNTACVHLTAASRLINQHNAEILQSGLGRALCVTVCTLSRISGFVRRKAVTVRLDPTVPLSVHSNDQTLLVLDSIVMPAPGLLEHVDAYLSQGGGEEAISLTLRLWNVRCALEEWEAIFYGRARPPGFRVASRDEAMVFAKWCDSGPFQEIFIFRSAQVWMHYNLYWAVRLVVDMSLLDMLESDETLIENMRRNVSSFPENVKRFLTDESYAGAVSICRSHPYSNEPDGMTVSPVGPDVATKMLLIFGRPGNEDELAWFKTALEGMSSGKIAEAFAETDAARDSEKVLTQLLKLRDMERKTMYAIAAQI